MGETHLFGHDLIHQVMEIVKIIDNDLRQLKVTKSPTLTLEEGSWRLRLMLGYF